MKLLKRIAILAITTSCGWAGAQTLTGVSVAPATAKPGEPVTITATFDRADNPNCSVRVHFGDGQTQDFKINQTKDVPMVTARSYAKAGDYKVMIEPKTALPMLKCLGDNQVAMVKIAAPVAAAPIAAAPKAAEVAAITCPEGWSLDGKSVNRRNGSYTCKAKAGTSLPAGKLDCGAPSGYFENKTRGQLGCRL